MTTEERRAKDHAEILEHRKDKRVELQRLVDRFEPTAAWKDRRQIGTLLNQLEEYCHQVNTFLDSRDFLQAADSMLDVQESATEVLKRLAINE